jgi:hypothetical protein
MNCLKIENLDLHASDAHGSSFNFKKYFEKKYHSESSGLNIIESFDLSIIEYFLNNFNFICHTNFNTGLMSLNNVVNKDTIYNYMGVKRKPTFFFEKNEYVVALNIVDKSSRESETDDDGLFNSIFENSSQEKNNSKYVNKNNSKVLISIYYPNYKFFDNFEKEFNFLENYKIKEEERNYVSVLIKNQYGEYDFEPLTIKVPKMKMELNYGEKFKDVYKKVINKLKHNDKGLYMFHGEPGTGKSSFIKYLTTVVKKEFIFIPTSFIERFISDPDIFAILLRRKKCVLILEDAEKILISRDRQENQFISTLLNLSDGILSDILEASIILTYNCDDTKIDKALKRKGRTMIDYKFNKLSVEESLKLAKHLKIPEDKTKDIKESMSLSEIYNIEEEIKFYEDDDNENKKIIGFAPTK